MKGENGIFQTDEQIRLTRLFFEQLETKKYQKQDMDEHYKEYGNFIWHIYSISRENFPNIKPSNITRLMYIATYLTYEGYLCTGNNKPCERKNLQTLLNLSSTETDRFYNEMVSNEIFEIRDNRIYINQSIFSKGSIVNADVAKLASNNQYITRLYVDGVRQLYKKATPRSHKSLSYLFQLIPYVNREYNICCYNPLETDLNKIEHITLGEFCEILGYTPQNSTKLCSALFDPKFTINDKEQTAIGYVATKGLQKEAYTMFVNPAVYYAGSDWNKVKVLSKF